MTTRVIVYDRTAMERANAKEVERRMEELCTTAMGRKDDVPAIAPLEEPLTFFTPREGIPRSEFFVRPREPTANFIARLHALQTSDRAQVYVSAHAAILANRVWPWTRFKRTGWEPRGDEILAENISRWGDRLSRDHRNRFRFFLGVVATQVVARIAQPRIYREWVTIPGGETGGRRSEAYSPPLAQMAETEEGGGVDPLEFFAPRADVQRPRFAPLPGEPPLAWKDRVLGMEASVLRPLFEGAFERFAKLDAPDAEWGGLFTHWRQWTRTGWEVCPEKGDTSALAYETRLRSPEETKNLARFFVGVHADLVTWFHQQPDAYPEWIVRVAQWEVDALELAEMAA